MVWRWLPRVDADGKIPDCGPCRMTFCHTFSCTNVGSYLSQGTLRHVTSSLSSYKQARDPPEFTTFSLACEDAVLCMAAEFQQVHWMGKEDIDGVISRNPGSRRASEAVPGPACTG